MKLSIINFSRSLPNEVKKLISSLQPELIYTGKDDMGLREFCLINKIDLKVIKIILIDKIELEVVNTIELNYFNGCEEAIKNGDLTIIVWGDPKDSNLFEHSLEYCRLIRKDFMVVYVNE